MSPESLNQFVQAIQQNEVLQAQLKAAPDREGFTNLLMEFAQIQGYTFSTAELADWIDAQSGTDQNSLSDEQLYRVAGGEGTPSGGPCESNPNFTPAGCCP